MDTKVNTEKKVKKDFNKKTPFVKKTLPIHITNAIYLVKNNAEIRRFTSKAMIAQLIKAGQLNKEDKVYIDFFFDKFAIIVNGLKQEFYYKNNSLFINCLAASFPLFINNAQNIINEFVAKEECEVSIDNINNIVNMVQGECNTSPVEG